VVELVVVIGRGGRDIPVARAWNAVAGLSVGQDLSERRQQMSGPVPQFSLAKSHRGFAPIGPALVTIDEIAAP
jgi:2,4-didehydro-3-deoxy-L-rhamnonate hydrolase